MRDVGTRRLAGSLPASSLPPRERLRSYASWCNAVEATGAEREAWAAKPRLPRRFRALTAYPVVRYLGRDDATRTVAGWQHWLDVVAGWLSEGRSPSVFIHAPGNVDALALARRFHDEVRTRLPGVEPLPEPIPAGPPALF